jgi:HAD superfamily hydrolase (TIGR01509 family)
MTSNALAVLDRLPDPAALLFDLDGTLVDTVPVRIEAWSRALEQFGIPADRGRLGGYIGSDGRWLAREFGRAAVREVDYAESEEIDHLSGAIFNELNVSPAPLPGATELLTALEESHLTFAIATSSRPAQVSVSVAALCLPSSPPITDGSHVANSKPAPDLLLASAAQLDVPPERCWYVGDSTWDMQAAVSAGMVAIGVPTGAVDATALLGAGAAVAVDSLAVLLEHLRGRGLLGQP